MIPRYSSQSNILKTVFLSYRNEVFIYTEDKIEDKEFYKMLLSRLTDNAIKINDIFPIGCKRIVIDRCQNNNSNDKCIFIIDGDLDLISDLNPKNIPNLFVLDSYCIENYLIDEEAAMQVLWYNTGSDITLLKQKFDFSNWLKSIKQPLIELFLHFSILWELSKEDQSYSWCAPKLFSAHDFLKSENKETILNSNEVLTYIEKLKTDIIQVLRDKGITNPNQEYNQLLRNKQAIWENTEDTLVKIVSGKDYLLPLLQFKINKYLKTKSLFPKDTIKRILATYCNLDRLITLKQMILN